MIYDDDTVEQSIDLSIDQQSTILSEVDELRELIEKLYIRQKKTEEDLVKTSEELDRVSRELASVKEESTVSLTTVQYNTFNKGDKVLVTTTTKNRYGDVGVVYRKPHATAKYIWVLPEGKLPGEEYRVMRKYLERRS